MDYARPAHAGIAFFDAVHASAYQRLDLPGSLGGAAGQRTHFGCHHCKAAALLAARAASTAAFKARMLV